MTSGRVFNTLLRSVFAEHLYTNAVVIGAQGRGKTNIAKYLVSRFRPDAAFYINVNDINLPSGDAIGAVLKTLRSIDPRDAKRVALVLDDLSYAAVFLEREVRDLCRFIANVRHFWGEERRYLTVTVLHHPRAALTFLRDAHVTIATSMRPVERKIFKESGIFLKNHIKNYLKHLALLRKEGKKRIGTALCQLEEDVLIVKFPRVRKEPWTDLTPRPLPSSPEPNILYVKVIMKNGEIERISDRTYRIRLMRGGKKYAIANIKLPEGVELKVTHLRRLEIPKLKVTGG